MSDLSNIFKKNVSSHLFFTNVKSDKNDKKQKNNNRKTTKKTPKSGKMCFFYAYYGNFSLISFGY